MAEPATTAALRPRLFAIGALALAVAALLTLPAAASPVYRVDHVADGDTIDLTTR